MSDNEEECELCFGCGEITTLDRETVGCPQCISREQQTILQAKDREIAELKAEYEVLEGCIANRLIDIGFGDYPTFSEAFDAIKSRIATLENKLQDQALAELARIAQEDGDYD